MLFTGTGITDLEAFRLQYFGSTANSGNGADANDFDLDGISNIMEFTTGTNPTQGNAAPGVLTLAGDTLEFVYSQAKAAINDGLTFSVEWTDDLIAPNWSSAGVTEVVLGEDDTFRQMKALVPAGNNGRRFVRLNVTGVTGVTSTSDRPSLKIEPTAAAATCIEVGLLEPARIRPNDNTPNPGYYSVQV